MKEHNKSQSAADSLLEALAKDIDALEKIKAEASQQIELVKDSYMGILVHLKESIVANEKSLKELATKKRAEIFNGRDRVDLEHGSLLFSIERRVKQARAVLANLEGFANEGHLWAIAAIKVTKSVDWDELEKWPQERLVMVGTERTRKEKFAYEIMGRR